MTTTIRPSVCVDDSGRGSCAAAAVARDLRKTLDEARVDAIPDALECAIKK
jgi:hypothetical protein